MFEAEIAVMLDAEIAVHFRSRDCSQCLKLILQYSHLDADIAVVII
jgi:hypothetical protein